MSQFTVLHVSQFKMWCSRVRFAIFSVLLIRGVIAELPGTLGTLLSDLVRLGDDLVRQDSAPRVEFWFFKASDINFNLELLLENLLAVEPYSLYPKLLLDEYGSLEENKIGKATLVVVFLDENQQCESAMLEQLAKIDMQSRVVVILPYISPVKTNVVMRCFVKLKLFSTFYVVVFNESNNYAYLNFIVFHNVIMQYSKYESFHQAFPEQNDLAGLSVVACLHNSEIWTQLDITLASLVIDKMNGSLQIMTVRCYPNESASACDERRFQPAICSFSVGRWMLQFPKSSPFVIPMYSLVIMVPNGIPLTVYEMLISPFAKSCWKFLASIFVLHAILMRAIWGQSFVESLSLTVYEINGSSLTRKTPFGKLFSLAAILLAFFILSAYEAKISSYLANWPHRPASKSLKELRESNVKIGMEPNTVEFPEDHWLRELVEPIDIASFTMGGTSSNDVAIIAERYSARVFLQISNNFDDIKNRPRYVLLDENVYTTLASYNFGYRNALLARFVQFQHLIYESGIDQLWMDLIVASLAAQKQYDCTPKMIQHEQLQHLLSILFSLWFCSFVVLMLELGYARIRRSVVGFCLRRKARVMPRVRTFTYPCMNKISSKKTGRKSI